MSLRAEKADISRAPRDDSLDASVAFLREGYTFVSSRCDRLRSDLFRTRLMLTPVVCMRGAEAAAIFYDGGRFTRVGAMPATILRLLQDVGSVQALNDAPHHHRKGMFLAMMTPPALQRMVAQFRAAWLAAVPRWGERQIVLQDEVSAILAEAAAAWAGVPLDPDRAPELTRQLVAMIEQTGSIGPANWWAQHLRNRAERHWQEAIRAIRSGRAAAPEGSAADLIARHRDLDGEFLDETTAAVELLNVLRPTVAVARFVTFAALALHRHPQWRETFAGGGEELLRPFVHEVRRFYPFFPVIGGRARHDFVWQGHPFSKGDWVLLDLYGTNQDERLWPDPLSFQPERFVDWPGDPYTLIPQGAGDYATGHRCPGEWLTIALVEEAVRLLTRTIRYEVPAQDLTVALDQLPALPKSGFIMQKTQLLAA